MKNSYGQGLTIGANVMTFDVMKALEDANIIAVDVIDLNDHEHDMNTLVSKLSHLRNKEFQSNERLVFLHTDTEFIIEGTRITLYNLQILLHDLGIPNYFCLIFCQQDIQDDLDRLRRLLTNDAYSIQLIDVECHLLHYPNTDTTALSTNPESVDKHYIFLNRMGRFHRNLMINFITSNDLLSKGLVSNQQLKEDEAADPKFESNLISSRSFVTTVPFSRINKEWNIKDENIRALGRSVPLVFKNFDETTTDQKAPNQDLLQKAFCYLASETVFDYPCQFTSEKSYKGFVSRRPMVMLGGPKTLGRLRDQGFITWSRWWDESYDSMIDPDDRFNAITDILRWICGLDIRHCLTMLSDMEEILKHNQQHYIDSFMDQQYQNVGDQLLKNLAR